MDYTQDSGAIVLGWLTKLAATIALVGLIAFDGVSLVQAHFSAADRAGTYASSAAEKYQGTKDINAAYAEAEAAAQIDGDSVEWNGIHGAVLGSDVTLKPGIHNRSMGGV